MLSGMSVMAIIFQVIKIIYQQADWNNLLDAGKELNQKKISEMFQET